MTLVWEGSTRVTEHHAGVNEVASPTSSDGRDELPRQVIAEWAPRRPFLRSAPTPLVASDLRNGTPRRHPPHRAKTRSRL